MLPSLIILCFACSTALPRPVTEFEAENQITSGALIGPDRAFGTVAAEASGRRAVRLDSINQAIKLVLTAPARGMTIRYSVPQSRSGQRQASSIIVEADGQRLAKARLASHYTVLGAAHGSPDGSVHHFWDETRILLPSTVRVGSILSLRVDQGGAPVAVDVIDTEEVDAPQRAPAASISVQRFGADPTGRRSSRIAFIKAIAAARQRHEPLYVPTGHYRVDGHVIVDDVAIVGAGSWHSIIAGHHLGFYSRVGGSNHVSLSGLAIQSDIWKRRDRLGLAAIGGRFSRSSFRELYLHNAQVGLWLDGPAHDLSVSEVEISDQAADGINLHRGIRHAVVENNKIRNVGDDGIASWSDGIANEDILIRGNRVIAPGLANGIAIYGGRNIKVIDNRIADVLTEGGGVHLGARFGAAPFSGNLMVTGNVIVRSGTMDPHWHFGIGAIWIYALERPIDADIQISRNRIEDAGCEAVQLLGPNTIDGVKVDTLEIAGSVTSVFALQTAGSLDADQVITKQNPSNPVVDVAPNFRLHYGPGNRGWVSRAVKQPSSPACT